MNIVLNIVGVVLIVVGVFGLSYLVLGVWLSALIFWGFGVIVNPWILWLIMFVVRLGFMNNQYSRK